MERDNDSEVQRVVAERESDAAVAEAGGGGHAGGEGGRGGFGFRFASFGPDGVKTGGSFPQGGAGGSPPRVAAWICLALAWLFLGSSVPFTVLIGVPLALAALLLAAVCLTRGGVVTGLAVLALGSVGSLAVYLVGLFRFLTQW